jgi:hypothetical protein
LGLQAVSFPGSQANSSLDVVNLPEQKRRVHGQQQLPEAGSARIGRELELPKLTFQVIRRTIATVAQKKATVKDIQGVAPALPYRNGY